MSEQSVAPGSFDFFSAMPVVVQAKDVSVSSDTGILPIRQFDEQIGLTDRFITCLSDPREAAKVEHDLPQMVRQRIYGILAGYEDCNDHDTLRGDPVFKLVSGRAPDEGDLASQPTLSRFENAVDIRSLERLHDFFIDDYIASHDTPPLSITLDIDPFDDPCHGNQQLALFHGFYDQYQYLPLMITCAGTKQIVWPALRPGNMHAATGGDDDLEYVVRRLRAAWPDVRIHVRGDGGCGVPWMYHVCERLDLDYTFGLATNNVLKRASDELLQQAVQQFEPHGEAQRLFAAFHYRAATWPVHRTVIVKAECNSAGTNRRFIVTNRPGATLLPGACYDEYAARGESENRNKEIKCGVAADRLSCHRFVANYFRLMMHAAALNLLVRLRRVVADPPTLAALGRATDEQVPVMDPTLPPAALSEPERRRFHNIRRRKDPLGQGHACTWQSLLIKGAGQVVQSARRILITIPAAWPHCAWFLHVCQRVAALRHRPQVVT